jgi:hypothetical protein
MKIICLVLFIYCVYYLNCTVISSCYYDFDDTTYEYKKISPTSADDCKSRGTKDELKDNNKCCYYYGSKDKKKGLCTIIDKYEYENIGKYVKVINLNSEIYKNRKEDKDDDDGVKIEGDIHIDCYSNYIKLSLVVILIILF